MEIIVLLLILIGIVIPTVRHFPSENTAFFLFFCTVFVGLTHPELHWVYVI